MKIEPCQDCGFEYVKNADGLWQCTGCGVIIIRAEDRTNVTFDGDTIIIQLKEWNHEA